ncbi:chromate transporter [Rhizobium halophytocola]|uniref:Chromate transporter n=1 Tax=Rhizobium halophytocola TaxID=735519 RepID=A0ABS4E0I8_9HYPH|nr:chromate transporter [Rhizobium halophytocola]MBP1851453.1 chromate transporter [Rhizobium halophytocola]
MSAVTESAATDAERPAPGLLELFSAFLEIGLMGFGGVLPLARRMIVEKRRWLTETEFTEVLGLCQFLPGGNILNMSVALGMKFGGWRGALAAFTGVIAAPTAIVICFGVIYNRYSDNPQVEHVFAGLAAAAAGLLIGMAWKIARPVAAKPWAAAIALVCFVAIAVLRLPLFWTLLVLAPISILISWRLSR